MWNDLTIKSADALDELYGEFGKYLSVSLNFPLITLPNTSSVETCKNLFLSILLFLLHLFRDAFNKLNVPSMFDLMNKSGLFIELSTWVSAAKLTTCWIL